MPQRAPRPRPVCPARPGGAGRAAALRACLTALLAVAASLPAPSPGQGAPSPPAVIVAEARLEPFVDRVEALGTARARESVSVTASVAEKIAEIRFDDGQTVQAGDVLAVLDAAEETAELKRAEATLAERRLALERLQRLEKERLAAQEDLDQRRLAVQQAEAEIEAIRARIADRVVRAPFDGVVGIRDVSVGTLVAPGDLITTLDAVSTIKLDFSVPSVYLPRLAPGLAIEARADALGERVFAGEVKSIDSRVDPVTRSVLVRALLPNRDGALRPGLLMRVELLKNPRKSIVIPEAAVLSQGQTKAVLVLAGPEGNRVERREVTIGARRPGEVEVLDGLRAGERVITDGAEKVAPGQVVEVRAVDDGGRSLRDLLGAADGS